jgi:probable HAF family extracellular repeat protein
VIIATNTSPLGPDVYGNLGSQGHNLIGNPQEMMGWVSSDLLHVNPMLGPLQNNGGPTQTRALLPGSPAIDAGDNTGAPMWDQRGPGYPRIEHGIIDIGAFEYHFPRQPQLNPNPIPIPVQAPSYTITDLNPLGTDYSGATGINNSGQAVGYFTTSPGMYHAFRYDGMTTRDIAGTTLYGSSAFGISDQGQVAGYYVYNAAGYAHAFLTAPYRDIDPSTDDLGTLGGIQSLAYATNDSGEAVGIASTMGDAAQHAFLYSGGVMHDLGTLGGSSSIAYGINDSGLVVGKAFLSNNFDAHAFLDYGTTMRDLGTLPGGNGSEARAINSVGHVVGDAGINSTGLAHAFLYTGTTLMDLGTLGGETSRAFGINDSDEVVGESLTTGGELRAILYSGGVMMDLNNLIPANSGWYLDTATSINDRGQIVGYGHNPVNSGHAYLLTPRKPGGPAHRQALPDPISVVVQPQGGVFQVNRVARMPDDPSRVEGQTKRETTWVPSARPQYTSDPLIATELLKRLTSVLDPLADTSLDLWPWDFAFR